MSENKEHRDIVDMILKILVDKQVSMKDALDISIIVQRKIQAAADSAWDNPLVIYE
jgi:hypothetical protein